MRNVKVLLTDNVDNLGIVGDVVSVRPGYARNFLYPRGIAAKPTEGNIKRLAVRRAEVERQMQEKRVVLEALFEKVKDHEITMQRSANEQGILFGGVSQHEIAQALRNDGLEVDDRMVRIGAQIKRLDSYMIPVVLASDLKTEVKLWVVSDKPAEQLQTEEEPTEEKTSRKGGKGKGKDKTAAEAEESAPTEVAGEEAKTEKKPKKKGKKAEAKAEDAQAKAAE